MEQELFFFCRVFHAGGRLGFRTFFHISFRTFFEPQKSPGDVVIQYPKSMQWWFRVALASSLHWFLIDEINMLQCTISILFVHVTLPRGLRSWCIVFRWQDARTEKPREKYNVKKYFQIYKFCSALSVQVRVHSSQIPWQLRWQFHIFRHVPAGYHCFRDLVGFRNAALHTS